MTDWKSIADALKVHMRHKEPQVKLRDVMQWFDLQSTSTADYYLQKLVEAGFIRRIDNGGKSLYFINWEKK